MKEIANIVDDAPLSSGRYHGKLVDYKIDKAGNLRTIEIVVENDTLNNKTSDKEIIVSISTACQPDYSSELVCELGYLDVYINSLRLDEHAASIAVDFEIERFEDLEGKVKYCLKSFELLFEGDTYISGDEEVYPLVESRTIPSGKYFGKIIEYSFNEKGDYLSAIISINKGDYEGTLIHFGTEYPFDNDYIIGRCFSRLAKRSKEESGKKDLFGNNVYFQFEISFSGKDIYRLERMKPVTIDYTMQS